MFPSLLIELELYAIVIGLSIAVFVFMARERMRRLKENQPAGEQPEEDREAMANPFMRTGSTF